MVEPFLKNPHGITLTVVVTREDLFVAFHERLAPFDNARVLLSRWEALPPHDCFVTAGNAFGLMNAGIDAAVVSRLGDAIQRRVQDRILDEFLGEQPVGTAFILPTGHEDVPYLCHAPTMRVPGGITGTDNVYRAARASFIAAARQDASGGTRIRSLVLPALGAGFGGVAAREVARQIAVAWRLFDEAPFRPDWDRIIRRERLICMDGEKRMVRP